MRVLGTEHVDHCRQCLPCKPTEITKRGSWLMVRPPTLLQQDQSRTDRCLPTIGFALLPCVRTFMSGQYGHDLEQATVYDSGTTRRKLNEMLLPQHLRWWSVHLRPMESRAVERKRPAQGKWIIHPPEVNGRWHRE